MSEHLDCGPVVAYRIHRERRQLFFDGTVASGWIEVDGFNPYAVYSFVEESEPRPMDEIVRTALSWVVDKGRPYEWEGVPRGLAAIRSYLADVQDPTKSFEETQGCHPPPATLRERARSPERIEVCAPLLEKGIEAEAEGLEALEEVVSRIA